MKTDFVATLDIGSTKAAVVCAKGLKGDLDVIAAACEPCDGMRRGAIVNLEEVIRASDAAVRKVQRQIGKEITSLIVGVGGPQAEGINSQGYVPLYPRSRTVTREDVLQVINHSRQVVLSPEREQIQCLPREFKVDGQRGIQKPVGMTGSRLEVNSFIVTAPTSMVENIEKVVGVMGKKLGQIVLTPLASGIGVLSLADLAGTIVVIDIGGSITEVAVFINGSIAGCSSIPLGSTSITNDISKLVKASPEESERLKVTYGVALSAGVDEQDSVEVAQLGHEHARPMQKKVLAEIIQSRVKEIASLIHQQVLHMELGEVASGVVLTGGGALLPRIDKIFEAEFGGAPVRVAPGELAGDDLKGFSMSAALGLAKFSLGDVEDELMPAAGVDHWRDRIRTFWSLIGKS